MNVEIDLAELTLEELELFEDVSGERFSRMRSGEISMKGLRGLIWIVRRRREPDLTFESLLKMNVSDLTAWADQLSKLLDDAAPRP